jgi:hypothetical protein
MFRVTSTRIRIFNRFNSWSVHASLSQASGPSDQACRHYEAMRPYLASGPYALNQGGIRPIWSRVVSNHRLVVQFDLRGV